MKRVVFLCSLLLICSLGAGNVGRTQAYLTYGSALTPPVAGKTCPFGITGTWRVEGGTGKAKTFLYEFNQDGVVIVTERTDDTPADDTIIPREFEVIGGGRYALDTPEAPKHIEFNGISMDKRGAIRRGKTTLRVVEYGDDNFVTVDEKTQAQTRWLRTPTQRCFLTFVARGGSSPSAFVMWTTLDGRASKIDALGLRTADQGGAAPVFGLIPEELSREFEYESKKNYDVMLRLELTEAEFVRSDRVFRAWNELARGGNLPHADPYLNGMEFLKSVVGNLNQCDEKLKSPGAGGATAAQDSSQQALEYIKEMKNKNKNLHVADGMFPWGWRPELPQN